MLDRWSRNGYIRQPQPASSKPRRWWSMASSMPPGRTTARSLSTRALDARSGSTSVNSRLTSGHVAAASIARSEEHTSELQSHSDLVCRLLLEKKKKDRYEHSASREATLRTARKLIQRQINKA